MFVSGDWLVRDPGFRFRFRRQGKEIHVQAYDEKNVMNIPVEWAFGAGEQAVTFVTRINKDWYLEHYFSYYSAPGRMGPTAGHSVLEPATLSEAMGLPYKSRDPDTGILGCFECHSTGKVSAGPDGEIIPSEKGVRCEACHGPGRAHADAAGRGDANSARGLIRNPKSFTAKQMLEYCGRCHRPPAAPGTQIDWNYAWNVRHQPVYLARSKCLTKSGILSCLTCHDPHSPLRTQDVSFYRERCLSCHDGRGGTVEPPASCLKNSPDCTSCHMPKVSPQPSLRFTNHWIGVYPEGEPLRPR